jgi:hypothetical protein
MAAIGCLLQPPSKVLLNNRDKRQRESLLYFMGE